VELWCSVRKRHSNGTIEFSVINGLWDGTLYANNTMKVHATGQFWPAILVWEGDVPSKYSFDYNAAIKWIDEELVKNE
jgi:hypothetical protein